MNTLITEQEAKTLGRPLGDIKSDKIKAYICEVEQTQIKPAIGDQLYKDLFDEDKIEEEKYDTLLNGGEYEDRAGILRSFSGLKVAIAYYVYVKTLMSGDIESTRFGFVQKDSSYSQHISDAARSAAYNEAMEVARHYLGECITYAKIVDLIKAKEPRKGTSSGGCIIRKIG